MTRAKEELYLCHARMREFRGSTMYAVPSMFIEELPKGGVQTIDLSASSGGTPPAIEQWRGGNEAAQQGWSDAGVRRKPAPIPPRTPATEGAGGKYVEGMLVRHGTYGQGASLRWADRECCEGQDSLRVGRRTDIHCGQGDVGDIAEGLRRICLSARTS